MPTITDEEAKLFQLFKKFQLLAQNNNQSFEDFCNLFCIAYANDLFTFPVGSAGEKIIRWDKDGNIRQIETHKVFHSTVILDIK
jgi:hypothetical protein